MSEEEDLEPGSVGDDGVIVVRVGGRAYPARHVAQCRTCRSKYRTEIERAIIGGMTYHAVVKELVETYGDHSPLGPPGYQSILRHVKQGHMPVPYSAQRQILEQRAREMGRSVEEGEERIADSLAILRSVVQTGFEMLNDGEIRPSMGDLLKALQLQASLEGGENADGVDEDAWRDALIAYMEIVQRHVAPDVFQRIGREMAVSPVLQDVALRRQGTVAGELERGD